MNSTSLCWLVPGLLMLASCQHTESIVEEPVLPEDLPGGVVPVSMRQREAVAAPRDVPLTRGPMVRVRHGGGRASLVPPPPLVTMAALRPRSPMRYPALLDPVRTPGRPAVPPGHPDCACAPNHRWLVGCLHHDGRSDRWSVRYADPGADDRYGGLLDLIPAGSMDEYRPGQLVRVEGEVVDPLPHELHASYRVFELKVLNR